MNNFVIELLEGYYDFYCEKYIDALRYSTFNGERVTEEDLKEIDAKKLALSKAINILYNS